MRNLKTLIVLGALALLTACASTQKQVIQLPATTPFDTNTFARQAYLDAYSEGYRSAQSGGEITPGFTRGPYSFARELGWRAGAAAVYNPESGSSNLSK
jgi:hypothetical protein